MTIGQYLPDSIESPIDLDDLILEFGVQDSSDVALQDFYLGGGIVPDIPFYRYICNIPENGPISFFDFYKRKSYILSSSVDSANEGQNVIISLNTTNVPDGALIPFSVSGIDSDDILTGDILGYFNIQNDSSAVSFLLFEDSSTEGPEILTLALPGLSQSISIPINDTSIYPVFANADFSDQTVTFNGTQVNIPSWTADRVQIRLGISSIGGFVSPSDPTPNPSGQGGQISPGDGTVNPGMTFFVQYLQPSSLINGSPAGKYCVRLYNDGTVVNNGGICHGPYIISNQYLTIPAGKTVSFDWRAAAGEDAYDVFAYLLRDNGTFQILLNQTQGGVSGDTGWVTTSNVVSQTGNYKFVFVSGTFDYSFGKAAGASLYVTNISITG